MNPNKVLRVNTIYYEFSYNLTIKYFFQYTYQKCTKVMCQGII